MTNEEIVRAAWREIITGAESWIDDWIDEEGEFGDDSEAVLDEQKRILAWMRQVAARRVRDFA